MRLLCADRVDEFVGEFLARGVDDTLLRVPREHRVPDRVHEVCFPEAGAPVNEERVV